MRRALPALSLAIGLVLAPVLAVAADVTSRGPDKVALVIYRARPVSTWRLTHGEGASGGVALIVETRTVDLPAGPAVIRFEGVSDQIVPQTAAVEGLPAEVLERNFDYDLLSPGSLIAKSLGQPVRLIDTNRKTGKATERRAVLRSGPDGVLLETAAGIEAFHCSLVPQRLVFDRIPEGLSDRPTLSLRTDAARAGRYTVRLSYLTTGLNWSADYVARLQPDGKTLDLEGWITLANGSSESFRDAPTQVVAGRLALTGDDRAVEVEALTREESCWPRKPTWARLPPPPPARAPPRPAPMMMARLDVSKVVVTGARVAKQENLGDYKLYTLPDPTTVAARQTKQVLFLDKVGVPVRRVYRFAVNPYDWSGATKPARVAFKLDNTAAGGLGLPLPGGTVSMREPDAEGGAMFTGEVRIQDTPKGLPVRLTLGGPSLVNVAQRVVETRAVGSKTRPRQRTTFKIVVTNAQDRPATVEITHPARGADFRVVKASAPHTTDAGDPLWTLSVPAQGHVVLTYTVETAG